MLCGVAEGGFRLLITDWDIVGYGGGLAIPEGKIMGIFVYVRGRRRKLDEMNDDASPSGQSSGLCLPRSRLRLAWG